MGTESSLENILPSSIIVLGRTIRVNIEKIATDEDGDTLGQTVMYEDRITIDPNQTIESGVETFYHELAHVMLSLLGLDYVTDKKTELFAQSLGLAMRNTTFQGGLLK